MYYPPLIEGLWPALVLLPILLGAWLTVVIGEHYYRIKDALTQLDDSNKLRRDIRDLVDENTALKAQVLKLSGRLDEEKAKNTQSYPLIKDQLDLQVKENQALKRSLKLTKERLDALDLSTVDAINDHIYETAKECISYVTRDAVDYLNHLDNPLSDEQEQSLIEDLEEYSIESLDDLLSQKFSGEMIANRITTKLSHPQICDLATDIQREIITNIKDHLKTFIAPLTEYQLKVINEDFDECHYDDTMRVLTRRLSND